MVLVACVLCFYARNGVLPPTLIFYDYESALAVVKMRQSEIACAMVNGDVISRDQSFKNYEEYLKKLNSFEDKAARAIVHRIMGPYRRVTVKFQI